MPPLFLFFLTPFIAALLLLLMGSFFKKPLKKLAFFLSLLPLSWLLYHPYQWLGAEINYNWIPALSIHFHLLIDSLSLVFLLLVTLITPIAILTVRDDQPPFPYLFYSLILALEGLLIGFFTARDLALFTFLWEAMLLPLYLIIALWGGAERQKSAIQFLVYMIAGSVLMVAAILFLFLSSIEINGHGTFNFDALATLTPTLYHALWLCAIFTLAFAVKTPLFPFHVWLPNAYVEAPIAGTILLSALLSKAGIYGFLRIGWGLFPTIFQLWSPVLLALSIGGVLYAGLAAWVQKDFKRLIAYSSLSHVNFILAGLFTGNVIAQSGAILQALNHGITITGLFLSAGWLEKRLGSTSIQAASGLSNYMPKLCWITFIFVLSAVALPGTNSFVAELLILFGLFTRNLWLASLLALTVILSVIYMLHWMQKVYFGAPSPFQSSWKDIGKGQMLLALPLIVLIFWIGLYPKILLNLITEQITK